MRNRHPFRNALTALLAVALLGLSLQATAADLRDPDAVYLTGIPGLKPIELTVTQTTAVYANRTRGAHLKNFLKGEKVHLVAYDPQTLLVKNVKTQYEGWVPAENLSELDAAELDSAIARAEEDAKYREAMKEKKVLAGMTLNQVKESLGKPDEAAFRTDANGRTDVWSYIEYDTIYQDKIVTDPLSGQRQIRRVRTKIPTAEKTIEFTNGRVTAIEKKLIR
jgi:hypothetical protein